VKRRGPNRRLIALRSDITQLKQAERSAVLQRVTAMDASQDGIATTDSAGRLVYINPALAHRAGAASEPPWIGRAWCDLLTKTIAMPRSKPRTRLSRRMDSGVATCDREETPKECTTRK
jgi:hypothetical protein